MASSATCANSSAYQVYYNNDPIGKPSCAYPTSGNISVQTQAALAQCCQNGLIAYSGPYSPPGCFNVCTITKTTSDMDQNVNLLEQCFDKVGEKPWSNMDITCKEFENGAERRGATWLTIGIVGMLVG